MDGILIVDKPKGITSHDVVDALRKRFGLRKAGHAGTLDPMATGLLVMLLGTFTKLSDSFIKDDKEYEAVMVLGASSDTGDACGKITLSGKDVDIEDARIKEVFGKFVGRIEQVPPMYSAIKLNGKKLYDLARIGVDVARPPREVFIRKLDITKISLPEVHFRVTCSKGTYIRQLSSDIGRELGSGAYLSYLRRTRSGKFKISDAIKFDELMSLDKDGLARRLSA